jgi:hypothetical protein
VIGLAYDNYFEEPSNLASPPSKRLRQFRCGLAVLPVTVLGMVVVRFALTQDHL